MVGISAPQDGYRAKTKNPLFSKQKRKQARPKTVFHDKNFQIDNFWMETQKYCHQPCLSNSDKELKMFGEQSKKRNEKARKAKNCFPRHKLSNTKDRKEMRKHGRPKLFARGQNLSRFAFSCVWTDWYHGGIMLNLYTYKNFKTKLNPKKIVWIVKKNCHQKLSSKIVIKNCHQKLSSKIVIKNCHQKLSSKIVIKNSVCQRGANIYFQCSKLLKCVRRL